MQGAGNFLNQVANTLRVFGPNGGIWVYSTPVVQLGSLISTVGIASAGTDAAGNHYLAGDTQYIGGTPGVSHATYALEFFGTGLTSANWTGAAWLPTAEVQLDTSGNVVLKCFGAGTVQVQSPMTATAGSASAPTLVTTDTWHDMSGGLLNGWTVTGGAVARYRLMEDNSVWIMADLSPGTLAGGTSVWTVPAGPPSYVPAAQQFVPATLVTTTAAAPTTDHWFSVQAHLQCHGFSTGDSRCLINARYPLD
jgi:hypothetical protein